MITVHPHQTVNNKNHGKITNPHPTRSFFDIATMSAFMTHVSSARTSYKTCQAAAIEFCSVRIYNCPPLSFPLIRRLRGQICGWQRSRPSTIIRRNPLFSNSLSNFRENALEKSSYLQPAAIMSVQSSTTRREQDFGTTLGTVE